MSGTSGDRAFRASQSYIWRSMDNLGNGAFGCVYKGFHKKTGQAVAVKTFNSKLMMSPQHLQQHARELDILKGLHHPNIVRLFCVENEVKGPGHIGGVGPGGGGGGLAHPDMVLIMELATQGSLYTIIDRPENSCGLSDEELLRVILHLSSGLRHLRENQIMHRDVKPSNILKTVTDGGEILYKLCDFGAARILAENEPFQSIVGTEEYLHPAIYNRALLGGSQSQFSANCDLWSIGVTIYHVSSGQLPFRPFGGARGNKNVMFKMTAEKPSGAISGAQVTRNGDIQWSRSLPTHCRMTRGLNGAISGLLQKLMELEKKRQSSYDHFFREVDRISQAIPIHFFNVTKATTGTLYVPHHMLAVSNILDGICEEIGGDEAGEMCVLWRGREVSSLDEAELLREVKSLNSPDEALLVLLPNHPDEHLLPTPIPSDLVVNGSMLNEQHLHLDLDVELSKKACILAHWTKREIIHMDKAAQLLTNSAPALLSCLRERLRSAEEVLIGAKKLWDCVTIQLDALGHCSEMSQEIKRIVERKEGSGSQIGAVQSEAQREILNVKSELIKLKTESTMNSIPLAHSKIHHSHSLNSLDQICEYMEDIFMQFKKDRSMKIDVSSTNEMKWHNLKKKQLGDYLEAVEKTRTGTDLESLKSLHRSVCGELKRLLDISGKLRKIECDLENFKGMVDAFQEAVAQVHKSHKDTDHREVEGRSGEEPQTPAPLSIPQADVNALHSDGDAEEYCASSGNI